MGPSPPRQSPSFAGDWLSGGRCRPMRSERRLLGKFTQDRVICFSRSGSGCDGWNAAALLAPAGGRCQYAVENRTNRREAELSSTRGAWSRNRQSSSLCLISVWGAGVGREGPLRSWPLKHPHHPIFIYWWRFSQDWSLPRLPWALPTRPDSWTSVFFSLLSNFGKYPPKSISPEPVTLDSCSALHVWSGSSFPPTPPP